MKWQIEETEWLKEMGRKTNWEGGVYVVFPKDNGELGVFERDPHDMYYYCSNCQCWHAKNEDEIDSGKDVNCNDIAESFDGGNASIEEQRRLVCQWELAAQEFDRSEGVVGCQRPIFGGD